MKKLTALNFRLPLLSLLIFAITGCDRSDPEVRKQAGVLQGRWQLVSIEANTIMKDSDTSWAYKEGYINFDFSNNKNLGPISYSLTEGDMISVTTSPPHNGEIMFNFPSPEDYSKGKVILLQLHKIVSMNQADLTITGLLELKTDGMKSRQYDSSVIKFTRINN